MSAFHEKAPVPHQPTVELSIEAAHLLSQLQAPLNLRDLPAQFPHVMNRLAALWNRPTQAERYMEELILSVRGSRQGFPLTVVTELTKLRHYYLTRLHPKRSDVWEQMYLR